MQEKIQSYAQKVKNKRKYLNNVYNFKVIKYKHTNDIKEKRN